MYIKDTKSSNGTFVNDQRLSPSGWKITGFESRNKNLSGEESQPVELHHGDKLFLGVDVTENNVQAHKRVELDVEIFLPEAVLAEKEDQTQDDDWSHYTTDAFVEEV